MMTEDDARGWLNVLPEYDPTAEQRLTDFVGHLAEENSRQNLVSQSSLSAVWLRHVVDSAQLLRKVPRGTSPWLDLGTGAGFPGLVVACLRPEMRTLLVESRTKRADWLRREAGALGLVNVEVIESRLEAMATEQAAVISARAFAPLDRLLPLAARFSTPTTIWLLPKGRSAGDELATLRGWTHTFHVEQSLTDADAGVITGSLIGPEEKRA